jgi:hypothetical protein
VKQTKSFSFQEKVICQINRFNEKKKKLGQGFLTSSTFTPGEREKCQEVQNLIQFYEQSTNLPLIGVRRL